MRRTRVLLEIAIIVCMLIAIVQFGQMPANAAGNSNTFGCDVATSGKPEDVPTESSLQLSPVADAPFDLVFIDTMIGRHVGAIALANAALQYAQVSEVRRIALRIVESQAGEIQLLRSWRDTWFPGVGFTNPIPEHGPKAQSTTVSQLCAAADFDRQFLEMMIVQHETTIELAKSAEQQAEHEDLRNFAASIVEIQSEEITSMQVMLERLATATPAS